MAKVATRENKTRLMLENMKRLQAKARDAGKPISTSELFARVQDNAAAAALADPELAVIGRGIEAQPVAEIQPAGEAAPEPAVEAEALLGAPADASPSPEPASESAPPLDSAWKAQLETVQRQLSEARAQSALREQEARAQQEKLEALVKAQREAEAVAADNAPITRATLEEYFTPEQLEEYGEQQCATQIRVARRMARVEVARVQEHVDERLKKAESEALEGRKDAFFEQVRRLRPDWRALDDSAPFREWLGSKETYSGRTWRQLGEAAYADNDPVRFAAIYDRFSPPKTAASNQLPPSRASTQNVETQRKPQAMPTIEELRAARNAAMRGDHGDGAKKTFDSFRSRLRGVDLRPMLPR